MEFNLINNSAEEDVIAIFSTKVIELLQKWIDNGSITGVYGKENDFMTNNLHQLQE